MKPNRMLTLPLSPTLSDEHADRMILILLSHLELHHLANHLVCVQSARQTYFRRIVSSYLVSPAGQLLGVDAYEAKEADNHDGDETVKDVVSAILCQCVVPTVRQVGQKES